ncbi:MULTISPECIES: hypothetical protein [Rhizobium]|uniref:hypothetical protein n=1 Tax=Rhizobium TaxID=379 RepID=UPI000FE000A6|nr:MULTISPECIES: hypothetical protein [Rhizobium]RVU04378.1 hypothetical protein EOS93_32660 [Rhizobium sp. RMa-01]
MKIGGGPSLPPDVFRRCGGRHTAALLRAVANLKRYKLPVVKSFLDSREKYGYSIIILNYLYISTPRQQPPKVDTMQEEATVADEDRGRMLLQRHQQC